MSFHGVIVILRKGTNHSCDLSAASHSAPRAFLIDSKLPGSVRDGPQGGNRDR